MKKLLLFILSSFMLVSCSLQSEADMSPQISFYDITINGESTTGYEGAVQRVRPKAMTVAVILAGLFPLFIGAGAGSEVMQRIAAPMLGGMLTAPVLSMVVIPAAFYLVRRRGLRAARGDQ